MNSCFTGLAIGAAVSRDQGILKRVRGTPLPAWAYLAARVVVTTHLDSYDAKTGELLVKNDVSMVVKGAGGWGGERGPATDGRPASTGRPNR